MGRVRFTVNRSGARDIELHLRVCDRDFVPPLSSRVDIVAYAAKIAERARRFEAWQEGSLIGLVAVYVGDPPAASGFVTDVSVVPGFRSRGMASALFSQAMRSCAESGLCDLTLETSRDDLRALEFYRSKGFEAVGVHDDTVVLRATLGAAGSPGL